MILDIAIIVALAIWIGIELRKTPDKQPIVLWAQEIDEGLVSRFVLRDRQIVNDTIERDMIVAFMSIYIDHNGNRRAIYLVKPIDPQEETASE